MFAITVLAAAAFYYPAVKFSQRCKIVNFYWVGFWAFLCWITAFSGAQAILIILVFVMFAWARLTLRGVTTLAKKVK